MNEEDLLDEDKPQVYLRENERLCYLLERDKAVARLVSEGEHKMLADMQVPEGDWVCACGSSVIEEAFTEARFDEWLDCDDCTQESVNEIFACLESNQRIGRRMFTNYLATDLETVKETVLDEEHRYNPDTGFCVCSAGEVCKDAGWFGSRIKSGVMSTNIEFMVR